MQVTSFFDAMIRPMPPEMSQVSVPTFVRLACADAGIGSATAAATTTAAALKSLCMCGSLYRSMPGYKRQPQQQVPCEFSLASGEATTRIVGLFVLGQSAKHGVTAHQHRHSRRRKPAFTRFRDEQPIRLARAINGLRRQSLPLCGRPCSGTKTKTETCGRSNDGQQKGYQSTGQDIRNHVAHCRSPCRNARAARPTSVTQNGDVRD